MEIFKIVFHEMSNIFSLSINIEIQISKSQIPNKSKIQIFKTSHPPQSSSPMVIEGKEEGGGYF